MQYSLSTNIVFAFSKYKNARNRVSTQKKQVVNRSHVAALNTIAS